MEPCAAGLPRVSDIPRNTKSEVPPRLPEMTTALSACAATNPHNSSSIPIFRFTIRDSLRVIHARGESDESPCHWQLCDCHPDACCAALTRSGSKPMSATPGRTVERWVQTAIVLCVLYSVACALALKWGGESVARLIGAWATIPLMLVAGAALWPVVTDAALSPRRRLAYRLFFGALVLDLVASVGWGYQALAKNVSVGAWPDVL